MRNYTIFNSFQKVSTFVKKIMLMLTTSSDLHLVGIDTFTGPSSVMRIPNGRTHLTSYSYGKNWRYRVEEDYDYSSESDSNDLESNFASDRLALGLRAYGPLKLEDVKNA
jgi:hypothetical protein